MAHEKQYTARQASLAVLEKVNKLLEDSRVYAQLQDLEKKEGKMSSKERQIRAKVGLLGKPSFKLGKCDKCGSDMQKGEEAHDCVEKAESGHEKGIHVSATRKEAGKSHVGAIVEGAHEVREHGGTGIKNPDGVAKVREEGAKKMHRNVLSEMRSMKSPDLGKAEPKGEIHPKEHVEGEPVKPGARIEAQKDPQHNPKEEAEGNNELAGTTPTQVGQDGKNVPGGDEIKSHLKLAKWIGRMEHKRSLKGPV